MCMIVSYNMSLISFVLATTVHEEQEVCLCNFPFFEFVPCSVLAKRISLYEKAVTIFFVYICASAPVSFLVCFVAV